MLIYEPRFENGSITRSCQTLVNGTKHERFPTRSTKPWAQKVILQVWWAHIIPRNTQTIESHPSHPRNGIFSTSCCWRTNCQELQVVVSFGMSSEVSELDVLRSSSSENQNWKSVSCLVSWMATREFVSPSLNQMRDQMLPILHARLNWQKMASIILSMVRRNGSPMVSGPSISPLLFVQVPRKVVWMVFLSFWSSEAWAVSARERWIVRVFGLLEQPTLHSRTSRFQ